MAKFYMGTPIASQNRVTPLPEKSYGAKRFNYLRKLGLDDVWDWVTQHHTQLCDDLNDRTASNGGVYGDDPGEWVPC